MWHTVDRFFSSSSSSSSSSTFSSSFVVGRYASSLCSSSALSSIPVSVSSSSLSVSFPSLQHTLAVSRCSLSRVNDEEEESDELPAREGFNLLFRPAVAVLTVAMAEVGRVMVVVEIGGNVVLLRIRLLAEAKLCRQTKTP